MTSKRFGLMMMVLAGALAAQATQYWWSGNGTTLGGGGTWDANATPTHWGTSVAGPFDQAWPNGGGDTAIFTNNPGTVTLGATINVNALLIPDNGSGWTFTNGMFNFGSNGSITMSNSPTAYAKIYSALSGSGILTVNILESGYGKGISLYGNNTNFTGNLVVNDLYATWPAFLGITNDFNLGAVPVSYIANALTLNNVFLSSLSSAPITIPPNRGITLASGGGAFHQNTFIANSRITGVGSLSTRDTTLIINCPSNDYSGANSLYPNNSTIIMGVDNGLPHGTGKGDLKFADSNGRSKVNLNGHTLTVNGVYGQYTDNNYLLSNFDNTNASPASLVMGDGNANGRTFTGIITNSNGALSLTKIGTGTQTLQGKLSYTGSSSANGGTLVIDQVMNTNQTLGVLSLGGGTLSLYGGGVTTNSSQTFGNVTLNSGASGVIVTNRGGNATLTLGNTWARATGGVALITLTPGSGGTSALKSSPPLTNEIVGGYVLVRDAAGTGFATTNASGNVVRYTGATALDATAAAADLIATANYVVSADQSLTGSSATQTVNSLEFSGTAALTSTAGKTLMVGSGGLLFNSSGYGKTQNLKLTSGSGEFDVYVSAAGGQIEGEIKDNGGTSVSFVKWGIGTLYLAGNFGVPSYSGNTVVNEGTLAVQGNGNVIPDGVGNGNLVVNGSGMFDLNGRNEVINGLSSEFAAAVVKNTGSSTNVLTLGNGSATASFAGLIGSGGAGITLIKIGAGTQTLSGANTYRGGTILSNGVLSVSSTNNIGGANAKVTFAGGTLQITGTAFTSFGATPLTFTSLGGGLDIADAGNSFTLTNNLASGTVLTKTGAGTLMLTGTQAGTINTDDSSKISFGSGLGFYNLGILSGGVLSPAGSGTVGTLAVNNNLTLSGKLLADVTLSTSDSVTASGTITLSSGATLEIVNPSLLNRSQRYTLLTAGVGAVSGSLTPLNLPNGWKLKAVGNTVVLYYSSGTMISFF